MIRPGRLLLSGLFLLATLPLSAQLDPARRQLIQFGYNQPMEGRGPVAGYAYYYRNQPDFPRKDQTLRLVVAPVYLDTELGFKGLLGPHTDLAIGLSGGGFADGHSEIRGGRYLKDESFDGHGGQLSASIYHLFNPQSMIPLTAVARAVGHQISYEPGSRTATGFQLPRDGVTMTMRAGLRWGGREPLLTPALAMEISAWYEPSVRARSGLYGFGGDRRTEPVTHLVWARALLAYTLPERGDNFSVSLTAGTSAGADRLAGYRLGAALPLASEFPLSLPGYYYQEISARRFVLLGGLYSLSLDRQQHWKFTSFGTVAAVEYVPGMQQPGAWHSGVGGGLTYASDRNVWQLTAGYAYGVDALRSGGRGAHMVGLLAQYDLETHLAGRREAAPEVSPEKMRGLQRLFRGVFGN